MFDKIGSALGVSGSDVFGGLTGALGTYYQNEEAKKAAERQMAFQREMSSTAYQRAMADMRKAGLNPILAGRLGGASTPGGAMYQPGNIGTAINTGVGAMASARVSSTTEAKIEQEIDQLAELHGERWERLFATMGPENILASVQAVLAGVSVKQVLQNAQPKTHLNTREALDDFVNMVRSNKSWILSNISGFAEIMNRFLPKERQITEEEIKMMIDGSDFVGSEMGYD